MNTEYARHAVFISVRAKITVSKVRTERQRRYNIFENKALARQLALGVFGTQTVYRNVGREPRLLL
jgi:hypothetical protein